MRDAFALAPGEGDKSELGGGSWRLEKVSVGVTGGWNFAEEMSPPGFQAPMHIHHTEDGAFYILEGTLLMRLGHMELEATAGTFVFMPRDVPHTFKVVSSTPARWINVQGPTGDFATLAKGMSALLTSGASPVEVAAKRVELSKKHGLEIV